MARGQALARSVPTRFHERLNRHAELLESVREMKRYHAAGQDIGFPQRKGKKPHLANSIRSQVVSEMSLEKRKEEPQRALVWRIVINCKKETATCYLYRLPSSVKVLECRRSGREHSTLPVAPPHNPTLHFLRDRSVNPILYNYL